MLVEQIRARLKVLQPDSCVIEDQSARHAGHPGSTGGGHYTLRIVSSQFSGKSRIMRHRLVYEALGELFPTQIHALSLRTLTPDEIDPSV